MAGWKNMKAYLLVALSNREERMTLENLRELDEVEEAHVLFGEWDLIAKINIPNGGPEELGTFVMDKIRPMPEIKLTSTLIVASKQ